MKKIFVLMTVLTLILSACQLGGGAAAANATQTAQANVAQVGPVLGSPTPGQQVVNPTTTIAPANTPTAIPPTKAIVIQASATPAPVVMYRNDQVWNITGLPQHFDQDETPVQQPGQERTTAFLFTVDMENVQLQRIVCDDMCLQVLFVYPDGTYRDITALLEWIHVPAGGTGDIVLDPVLVARGLNLVDGETLKQNTYAVFLGAVKKGSYILVHSKDDPKLGKFVGTYIRLVTTVDTFTRDLATATLNPKK